MDSRPLRRQCFLPPPLFSHPQDGRAPRLQFRQTRRCAGGDHFGQHDAGAGPGDRTASRGENRIGLPAATGEHAPARTTTVSRHRSCMAGIPAVPKGAR